MNKQPSTQTVIEVTRKTNGHYEAPVSTESSDSGSETARKSSPLKSPQFIDLKGFTSDENNSQSDSDKEIEPGTLKRAPVIDLKAESLDLKSESSSNSSTEPSDDSDGNEQKKENMGIEPNTPKRGPVIIDLKAEKSELSSESESQEVQVIQSINEAIEAIKPEVIPTKVIEPESIATEVKIKEPLQTPLQEALQQALQVYFDVF